jgi:hypothetical protein
MVSYPCIRFVCRYGRKISQWTGIAVLLLAVSLAYQYNSIWVLGLGLVSAFTLSTMLRLLSEIVEVVADALLPR